MNLVRRDAPRGHCCCRRFFSLFGHDAEDLIRHGVDPTVASCWWARIFLLMSAKSLHHFFFGLQRPKVITVDGDPRQCRQRRGHDLRADLRRGRACPALGLPGDSAVFRRFGVVGAALGTVCGGLRWNLP